MHVVSIKTQTCSMQKDHMCKIPDKLNIIVSLLYLDLPLLQSSLCPLSLPAFSFP